jgi:membrane-associated phospholipid phosphatase
VRASEWVATGYFSYLLAVAVVRLPGARRRTAARFCLASLLVVLLPRIVPNSTAWREPLRDWLPVLSLLLGYWLSGHYFLAPMPGVERRFLAVDRWLYEAGLSSFVRRAPRALLELLELAYMSCFIFVPGGMVLLFLAGATAHADRFWTLVLIGEFGSFGMLPWIQTRPPRDLEPRGVIDQRRILMRDVNRAMVKSTSIGYNTFPSGHVAGSLAVALAVSEALPGLTVPMLTASGLISVSTVVGRYHYAVDAVAGLALTLTAWTVLRAP